MSASSCTLGTRFRPPSGGQRMSVDSGCL
jgi:hypothetical protein